MKKVTVQIHLPPFSGARVIEALDTAMVSAVFDFEVSLLFRDQGVLCLMPDQDGATEGIRTAGKVLQAMPTYEVKNIYACSASVSRFGFANASFDQSVTLLQPEQIGALLQQQDAVIGI